ELRSFLTAGEHKPRHGVTGLDESRKLRSMEQFVELLVPLLGKRAMIQERDFERREIFRIHAPGEQANRIAVVVAHLEPNGLNTFRAERTAEILSRFRVRQHCDRHHNLVLLPGRGVLLERRIWWRVR